MEDLKYVDVCLDSVNAEKEAWPIVQQLRPAWQFEDTIIERVEQGFQNTSIKCRQRSDSEERDTLMVRIYGETSYFAIDHELYVTLTQTLHSLGIGEPVYCKFKNGVVLRYAPGAPLSIKETISEDRIRGMVAREVAKVHHVNPNSLLPADSVIAETPIMFSNLARFLANIPEDLSNTGTMVKSTVKTRGILAQEVEFMKKEIEALELDVVFTHMDVNRANIIHDKQLDTIRFIDYEYCGFNYYTWDLAYYMVLDAVDIKYPDDIIYQIVPKATQLDFFKTYLETRSEQCGKERVVTEEDTERIYHHCQITALAVILTLATWDYMNGDRVVHGIDITWLANMAIKEYFRRKEILLAERKELEGKESD